jgi:putative endonuclease
MKQQNFKKGRTGEEIAASYLRRKGFQIIEQNFHTRFGEIDLIATNKNKLHFVEVKLKVGDRFGTPEEMINKRKIWQVMKTAESYLLSNKQISAKYPRVQVDAVCIVINQDGLEQRVDYYEDLSSEL